MSKKREKSVRGHKKGLPYYVKKKLQGSGLTRVNEVLYKGWVLGAQGKNERGKRT